MSFLLLFKVKNSDLLEADCNPQRVEGQAFPCGEGWGDLSEGVHETVHEDWLLAVRGALDVAKELFTPYFTLILLEGVLSVLQVADVSDSAVLRRSSDSLRLQAAIRRLLEGVGPQAASSRVLLRCLVVVVER